MHIAALDRQASLARVHKRSPDGAARRNLDVGVFQHQHGIFAAEFEYQRKQAFGGALGNAAACTNASSKNQFVDLASDERRPGRAFAREHLENIVRNSGFAQQHLQFERNQRRQLGGLEHDRISRNQSRQRLRRRNRKGIIPRRDDSDDAIGLVQNASGFGFHHRIAVGQLFIMQDRKCVIDQESRRVENDQNFGEQRLHQRLADFLRDAPRDVGLARQKNLQETAKHSNAIADAPSMPILLCRVRARDGGAHFGWAGAVQFAQNLARRRVHGSDAGNGEFGVNGHLRRSVRGTQRVRQSLFPPYELSS